uniref:Uncharacterized protein n=1 Tax=Aureoumbra lagunensis TaxID=44058 RepID=A0A7S3JUT8_9STRA|mmetsp:Transcript_8610/g.10913  ORF Transcript_8610/g.10913 Transcript_8610/m.10913 type:complete len:214 (+) Transcript_8610:1050-1691(+)
MHPLFHVDYYPPPSPEEASLLQGQGPPGFSAGGGGGRPQQQQQQQQQQPAYEQRRCVIPQNSRVVLKNLVKKPELNGCVGVLVAPDARSGPTRRYKLTLDDDGLVMAVKQANFTQLLAVTHADDGRSGTILDVEDDVRGYLVDCKRTGDEEFWAASDTVAPRGTVVLVSRVNSDDWRDSIAFIEHVDLSNRRYRLVQQDSLHRANIRFGAVDL